MSVDAPVIDFGGGEVEERKLTINGVEVTANDGESISDVIRRFARENGIERALILKDGEPVGMDEVEWCCNPIYLWESLLHGYIRQKANPGIGLQVAIPFIYGSHCYGDEFSIECEITKVDKGCNPIFLWESLLLTKWKNVLYLNENKLQSHFHMGVIATSVP